MSGYAQNTPELWLAALPVKQKSANKYDYGRALIYAVPEMTGATRLAASACARIGTGSVTVCAPSEMANVYRMTLPAHMIVRENADEQETRITAKLYGPGGLSAAPDYASSVPTVLDADAINGLSRKLRKNFVLTPHEGEFARAFPDLAGDKVERAKKAAGMKKCHIVLKGAETVIAAPDGKAVVNRHASPVLATAGSGDVLAGMITGLLAQKVPVFEACCAAVWIHGDCALRFGEGLVAEDLPDLIPQSLQALSGMRG